MLSALVTVDNVSHPFPSFSWKRILIPEVALLCIAFGYKLFAQKRYLSPRREAPPIEKSIISCLKVVELRLLGGGWLRKGLIAHGLQLYHLKYQGAFDLYTLVELLIWTRESKDPRVQAWLASPSPAFKGLMDSPEQCIS